MKSSATPYWSASQMNDLMIPPELQTKLAPLHQQALDLTVVSRETCEAAVALAGEAAGTVKKLEDFFDPNIATAYKLHKDLVAQKKRVIDPALQAKSIAKAKANAWMAAEEEKRLAEQRRLQAEADERARQEREALEEKAMLAESPEQTDRFIEEAQHKAAPVVLVAPPPKVAGAVVREKWTCRVVDRPALMAFIEKENPFRWDLLTINEAELKRIALAQREMAKLPGVEFYVERELAVRSA